MFVIKMKRFDPFKIMRLETWERLVAVFQSMEWAAHTAILLRNTENVLRLGSIPRVPPIPLT